MKYKFTFLFVFLMSFLGIIFDVYAIPVKDIPNLSSITFWERTGGTGPNAYTFSVGSAQLNGQLSNPLSSDNYDFMGVPYHEFYDVFFSDADGTFSSEGEYLTIEGSFDLQLPQGGGLNLAEIGLNFSGEATEYGNWVASFVALGDNAYPELVYNAIDGDLLTHTTMGNTVNQTQRLRITLGFESSSGPAPVPEPATIFLLSGGIITLGTLIRRSRK